MASQPDYAESARNSVDARLTDRNLDEIRRGSVDLGTGGAVPAADIATRNGSKKTFDRMSKTMTNFGFAKHGSQASMNNGRNSVSPRPGNRQSIGVKDYTDTKSR